jgi:hypothetical protein
MLLLAVGCRGAGMGERPSGGDLPASSPSVPGAGWDSAIQAGMQNSRRQPALEPSGAVRLLDPRWGLLARIGEAGRVELELSHDAAGPLRTAPGELGIALRSGSAAVPRIGGCDGTGRTDASGDCLRRVEREDGGVLEWWRSADNGLQQGWEIAADTDPSGVLILEIEVSGASVQVDRDGRGALLHSTGGGLRYSDLIAWDANEIELDAGIQATPLGLEIHVDDEGAAFPIAVDPLITPFATMIQGNQGELYLGGSVASAGDVNDDGYGDVIVGSYQGNGTAWVHHGSPSGLSSVAATTLVGPQSGDFFGYHVAGAGDLDGDGFSDVVVGAFLYNNGQSSEGAAFVYMGSASGVETSPSAILEADQSNVYLGDCVASAGDLDGDGYGDLAVSAEASVS